MRRLVSAATLALATVSPTAWAQAEFDLGEETPFDSGDTLGLPEEVARNVFSEVRTAELLKAQILLDHTGHSPGTIDGVEGANTRRAILSYEVANGLAGDGEIDSEVLQLLEAEGPGLLFQRYTITDADVAGPLRHGPARHGRSSAPVGAQLPKHARAPRRAFSCQRAAPSRSQPRRCVR